MFMNLENAAVHYEERGTGIPLIFIHGYHIDHKCFFLPVEKFLGNSAVFRRIYPDLPGMGRTRLKEPVSSTDEISDILIDFIDRIASGGPFAVATYSYGGYLARALLRERREKLLGFFHLCPVIIPDRKKRMLPEFHVFQRDEEFFDSLSDEKQEFFTESVVFQNRETYERLEKEIWEPLQLADRKMLKNLQRSAYGFARPVDHLKDVFEGPVQFLAGKQDSVVGYEDILSIFGDYPAGELSVIDRAGHNLMIDQPGKFEGYFKRWLGKVADYSSSMAMA